MSGHAGNGLHYHGIGKSRYGHAHTFLHINHEHNDDRCNAILSHYGTGPVPRCILPAGHYVGFHQAAPTKDELGREETK